MKQLICILIAILTAINGVSAPQVTEENIQTYIAPDCQSVANFIAEHLPLFVKEYNGALEEGEEPMEATACDAIMPVTITTTNQQAVCLDFNGDNGYLIVADDYEIVAHQTKGEVPATKFYSLYDGFLYEDGAGNLLPYDQPKPMTEEDWIAASKEKQDGEIYNPDLFVKQQYGTGYKLYKSKELKNFKYMSQYDLSIYYELKNGVRHSEGNCALSSIYALLNYLQESGKYKKLPKASAITSYAATKKDPFYNKYKQKGNYVITTPKILPKLYENIRSYAVQNYGYEVGGVNPFHIATMIKNVGKQYGCNIKANHILIWSYEGQVVKEIDSGYPTIWNMANSSTYGSHSTVVTGYRTYRKEKTFLGIKLYDYVKLLALNDNWNKSVRYFDFTNYIAFGSFVQVR